MTSKCIIDLIIDLMSDTILVCEQSTGVSVLDIGYTVLINAKW